ncbi:MAG: DUF3267 domain-containing protein [Clostridia bacterium]|nr:DUF3267 domain-containing protein [Clostridia bacterium]
MCFRVSWKMHIACMFIATIIVAALHKTLFVIILNTMEEGFLGLPDKYLSIRLFAYLVLLMVPIVLIHEFIHGIFYILFGGKIKYGFRFVYAYTMETSGISLSRTQFLIVLLSPLVVISVLSLFLSSWLGGTVYILNLIGSTGDIFMALTLLIRSNGNSRIIDRPYGFDIV